MNKGILKNSNYVRLLLATFITRFGDALDSLALSWLVYVLTGSKILMGTLFAVSFIPNLIFTPFGGVIADLGSKKKQTVIGDLGRGAAVSVLALMVYTDTLQVWHLFIFIIINSTFESFANPARGSLIALILDKENYTSGTSLSTSISKFGDLIGLGAAGIIIAILGVHGAIIIDGITFFLSAILIMTMKIKEDIKKSDKKVDIKEYLKMSGEGFSYVFKNSVLIRMALVATFLNFSFVPLNVLRPVYVEEVLKSGAGGLSLTAIGITLGIIVGGLLMAKVGDKVKPQLAMAGGLGMMGFNYALLGIPGIYNFQYINPLYYATVISFFFGFFLPVAQAPMSAYVLKSTDKSMLGRVSSIMGIIMLAATPIGGAIVGFVGEYVSVSMLFIIMGCSGGIVSIAFGMSKKIKIESSDVVESV